MKRKLTQAIAKEYARRLGGKIKKNDYDEFVVTFGRSEYFASDLEDALGTARIMAGTHPNIADAEQYLTDMGVNQ